MKEKINRINEYLHDGNVIIYDRMFMLISCIALSFEIVSGFINMYIINMTNGLITIGVGILFGIIILWGYRKKKLEIAAVIISCIIIFFSLPYDFLTNGGIQGTGLMRYLIATLYIAMILPGYSRKILVSIMVFILGFCVYLDYSRDVAANPLLTYHSYLESFAAAGAACIMIAILAGFQSKLFIEENKESQKRREEIERLNASQNRFFSSMSHEIRTPINTIIGLNEMILREDVSDEVADDAANIQSASKLLLSLINDILDMSKFESGQMRLNEVNYHPGDMLSEVVGMLWLRAKDKGLEFHVNVAPDIPSELYGDEVRIKQILINVLNNAIKYTKEGSVTLSIQCGEKEGNKQHILYSVTDTGMGIKKEDIPYLFTAFKRVDETSNRHIEGTGLGLAIVKQFVELMNGQITVNSVYTKGSTFLIDIPQIVESDALIGEVEIESKHRLNQRKEYHQKFEAPDARILVVDDNASNILVVKKLLRDTKVQLDTAESGEEALNLTMNKNYHVILMDHLMPEMDGIECLKKIRVQVGGRSRDSKVVALTANAGSDVQGLYVREGFDGYLTKPISGDLLEKELYRLLPKDIVHATGESEEIAMESIQWMHMEQTKKPVIVTTESVADIPASLIEKYGIMVIPHMVKTEDGIFDDGLEIETNGLLSYMEDEEKKVSTISPSVAAHETFFADALTRANNVIHISISSKVEHSGCIAAKEAAASFENVFVIDTQHLSSGQGLLAIHACMLADSGLSASEIVPRIEKMIPKISTSFIVDNLDFLARAGQVSSNIAKTLKAFTVHPVLKLQKGHIGVGSVYFGSRERSWNQYIGDCLKYYETIDKSILFVTYVGITQKEQDEIAEKIKKYTEFDEIYFQKASPAIAVNCGPGTFGLLYKFI